MRNSLVALVLFTACFGLNPANAEGGGTCKVSTTGPTLTINIVGLKDRKGRLRAELFPNNDADFLADNDVLVAQGKPFRRVDLELPGTVTTTMCMNTPPPGVYTFSVLHDRDLNRKFGIWNDGVGFAGNPTLGHSKPKAAQARISILPGVNRVTIILNYLRGLSFSPLAK